MQISIQGIDLLLEVTEVVQERFAGFSDLAHGWEHVQRVYHLALHLAERECADGLVVGLAALLHDLGRTTGGPAHSHAERRIAQKLLTPYGLPPESQRAVLHAIMSHCYRHGLEPQTLEVRVLYDADRLDSLGASGIMRWAMSTKRRGGAGGRTYHPDDPFALWREPDEQLYPLDRFFTRLLTLGDSMTTSTGRAMAEQRIDFLRHYLQELQRELAEGGVDYDVPVEFIYHLLWDEGRGRRQARELCEKDLQSGKVIAIRPAPDEQHHSA